MPSTLALVTPFVLFLTAVAAVPIKKVYIDELELQNLFDSNPEFKESLKLNTIKDADYVRFRSKKHTHV